MRHDDAIQNGLIVLRASFATHRHTHKMPTKPPLPTMAVLFCVILDNRSNSTPHQAAPHHFSVPRPERIVTILPAITIIFPLL
ncbi:hypothetical protein CSC3H3_05105 [Thalassospira marina]|uniref:Uncharacterized protein n=1 Tax=Thalassospira marina TaxID=2048283 RepID=A0ABM6Q6P1_9PROT|nr:hypothetical protein CSC3H3_05105 [Thalassospira marina]